MAKTFLSFPAVSYNENFSGQASSRINIIYVPSLGVQKKKSVLFFRTIMKINNWHCIASVMQAIHNENKCGGRVLLIMAYMGGLRPKGVSFSSFRYMKWYWFQWLKYIKG